MKRGLIRIVSGIVLIIMQILAIIGRAYAENDVNAPTYAAASGVGFYMMGIVGIILVYFGKKAYNLGIYSEIILHTKPKKPLEALKYIALSLLLLPCLMYFRYFSISNISGILMICSILSLAIYLLFYAYKKPSCLFSSSLIFVGLANFLALLTNTEFYYSLLVISDTDDILRLVLHTIPSLIASTLYIVIAVILYKEKFSPPTIRIMGCIVFGLEFLIGVFYDICVSQHFNYYSIILNPLPAIFFLYLSVFQLNNKVLPPEQTSSDIVLDCSSQWHCSCGRSYPKYVSSCVCGKSKSDFINLRKFAEPSDPAIKNFPATTDKICFCRKCGNKLIDGASFCSKCGTQIMKE